MLDCFRSKKSKKTIPIELIAKNEWSTWEKKQDVLTKNWLAATQFHPEVTAFCLIPNRSGHVERVICCVGNPGQLWDVGALPFALPEGDYFFVNDTMLNEWAIAWGLGAYQFLKYKKAGRAPARLVLSPKMDIHYITNHVESLYLVRDLINIPADDLGPTEFAKAAAQLAKKHRAHLKQIIGEQLLKNNYPAIYTVVRASDDPPRLLDLRWGNKKHFRLTLVGKAVCFDSGGLDLKSSSAMLLMKKDMAGGAHVLGLANMIMQAKLPICLRVLIPVVENVIGGNAYRPGDIIRSRQGLTIEIGNTDAEGRVILADALTDAASEKPNLLIDVTTLTGAARVALGTELPAIFSNDTKLIQQIIHSANTVADPLWQLPLFDLYRDSLNSPIADINNCGTDSYGGAITAALFLKEFVPQNIPWLHFDMMAWNLKSRPGRPQGGEAMALRGLFHYLTAQVMP